MRIIRFVFAVALTGSLAACNSLLDESPTDELPAEQAITDARGARAALAGAFAALQSESYYGGDFVFFGDLPADNAVHTGTFTSYGLADANQFRADNATVQDIWDAIYDGINRVNVILEKVPALTDLEQEEMDSILGEAHFLRALHYHNLVRLYGDVPLRLISPQSVEEAAEITRSPVADVYTQILTDLNEAENLITFTEPATEATAGAVDALQARVQLYRGDYAAAIAEADEVIDAGYELAPAYGDLFDAEGQDTPEDIFKVIFTAQQFNNIGWYYTSDGQDLDEEDLGGRREVAPDPSLVAAYDPDDERFAWSIAEDFDENVYGAKFPTVAGAEDIHAIRFAEVLLIKAEAQARLNDLSGAVDTYNQIRERAGLPPHSLGDEVSSQEDVLAAIDLERRLELAFEGDRWADLVRTGQAEAVLGIPVTQTLYPIPQQETVVAPGITQNPGY